jgi:hypothetical protein
VKNIKVTHYKYLRKSGEKCMTWFIHWDPSFDLARGGVELSFRSSEDMLHLLVETEAIRYVNSLINKITSPSISSRYHIIGTRGFGKSTILNYVAFSLYNNIQSQKVIPIHASLLGTASDEKELEFIFFRSLLESLFDIPTDIKRFYPKEPFPELMNKLIKAEEEYKRKLKEFGQVTLEFVYTAFENQLNDLKQYFDKLVFLIDGLDKQDTDAVLKFLRNTQERINSIISKYNCLFVDAADPSWRETLDTREFSGVRGATINLRGWTVNEVEALIRKRLERIGIFIMPFDRKALDILVEDFQGNPREILQYATTLLHYAAKERHSTIGPGIARKIVWSDDAKEKFFEKVISDTDMRYAFEKLRDIYTERQMMNILVATYHQRNQRLFTKLNYDARSSVGITVTDLNFQRYLNVLISKGCLRRSKVRDFVELEDDVKKLLDYAVKLGQSLVALPVILSELEFKVRPVTTPTKEELIMKDEIQTIFEQHPTNWLDYRGIKQLLLENPRTVKKLQEHFKEDYQKKVTSTIPLIVHKLKEEAKLMLDEATSSYRWRPSWIDYDTAELFRSKGVIDKIDSAEKALLGERLDEFTKDCKDIFWELFSKINELYRGIINVSNLNDVVAFLEMLDVNVQKPFPLKLFLSSLKDAPSDLDEARIRLRTALLYAKRIRIKLSQLQRYEAKNEQIIKKLRENKVGVTKESERHDFNTVFLPILLRKYGRLVDCMTKIKMREGFIVKPPSELKSLIDQKWLLPAKLFECPECKKKTIVSAGEIKVANCQDDRVPLNFKKNIHVLSDKANQAWNVWMEEYSRYMLQKLPCKYVESGVSLKPLEHRGVTAAEEVDVVAVYNGLFLAVECIENVSCVEKKNDVLNTISKIESLGLFDAVILIYRNIDNRRAFKSIVKRYQKLLYPVLVQNPNDFKRELHQTLALLETNLAQS